VLLRLPEKQIVSFVKRYTTKDVQTGVYNAIIDVIREQPLDIVSNIKAVMLGTTAFINAVLQCSSELAPVSVIRLCGPSTHILPPFIDWPNDLRKRI